MEVIVIAEALEPPGNAVATGAFLLNSKKKGDYQ